MRGVPAAGPEARIGLRLAEGVRESARRPEPEVRADHLARALLQAFRRALLHGGRAHARAARPAQSPRRARGIATPLYRGGAFDARYRRAHGAPRAVAVAGRFEVRRAAAARKEADAATPRGRSGHARVRAGAAAARILPPPPRRVVPSGDRRSRRVPGRPIPRRDEAPARARRVAPALGRKAF